MLVISTSRTFETEPVFSGSKIKKDMLVHFEANEVKYFQVGLARQLCWT